MNANIASSDDYAAMLDQCDMEIDDIYHDYAQKNNLSDAALWLLYAIYTAKEEITQADICNGWFFSRQTINTALKGLEKQGILEFVLIPENRKSKKIAFTQSGKALAEQIIVPLQRAENRVLDAFDDEEKRLFVELSQKRCVLFRELLQAEQARSFSKDDFID